MNMKKNLLFIFVFSILFFSVLVTIIDFLELIGVEVNKLWKN